MRAATMAVALLVALTLTACQGADKKKETPAKPAAVVETLPKGQATATPSRCRNRSD